MEISINKRLYIRYYYIKTVTNKTELEIQHIFLHVLVNVLRRYNHCTFKENFIDLCI